MVGPYINTWPSRFQPRGLPETLTDASRDCWAAGRFLRPTVRDPTARKKKALNPIAARPIEVFRNAQLTCHEAQALCIAFVLGAYWDELSKRFPVLGDYEASLICQSVNQVSQVGFDLMDPNCFHMSLEACSGRSAFESNAAIERTADDLATGALRRSFLREKRVAILAG